MVDRAAQRRVRAGEADELLYLLLAKACDALGVPTEGVALVAVGGYGREELSPYSDLDVMLVHVEGYPRVDELAAQIWYPLWDSRTRLDHSVRTIDDARQAAADDVRVALGLLDARHVAGDSHLTLHLRSVLMADWRRTAKTRLPALAQACRDRADTVGELAHLAEPDLKEAYGGLRDAVVLRALVASWLIDVPHPVVERARLDLLNIRDELHSVAGRATDRLVADVAGDVAAGLGLDGRDELLRQVYSTGRTLAHVCDVSWRRIESLVNRPPRSRRRRTGGPLLLALDEGVGQHEGEVVLMPDARPERDAALGLRAAAVAADRELVLSPAVCDRLAATAAALPEPWPGEARRLFCALLGAGQGLLEVWEAMDQAGYVSRLLPEWESVRFRPPQSAVHRFTVDRHLLETCVEASKMVRDVRRPDLLLVAALLHDLGKAVEGDHSVTGAVIAAVIGRRLGFSEVDADTITLLVRQHLMLAQVATRRDLDDPMTVDLVAGIVGDTDTLDLLEALTYADARAAGPAASSPWRLRLVGELCRRVRGELSGGGAGLWTEAPPVPVPELHQVVGIGRLGVTVSDHHGDVQVNVAVPDQVGTLSTVAAVLAVERLAVRSAVITSVEGLGISQWTVAGSPPDPVRLRDRLSVALRDNSDLVRRLAARDSSVRKGAASRVDLLPDASETATVLQIRAHDRPGLLYDITAAIASTGADIRSAHVSTLGAECVDVFYLTDGHGSPLDEEDARVTAKTILDRLTF
ncbi:UTP-GlnB uridylyltransferase, GlnD [Kribbella flavida DSM 17836]|uniref:Bifunctional uridylyltransferase/uridylyl-removing enzyme n=1 Tax=Kribbella flavida (strain DSM 17836 / JCM 10339 / NBRC 14399) TaxID=479435 RepID=D2Q0J6_KRIFD|nr:[protein-PII] uridylyltransferase [Kribbella flavida]ADB33796.1 UTP-GlnB uridylyltransferase, GlnD [Kribbella flavida DSM 17836]